MFAVIRTGGKQYRVAAEDVIKVETVKGDPGESVQFGEVLVVGPGAAKLEFIKHVHKRDHALEPKIIGVETVDHPTDGQLVDFVRRYFRAADRMLGTAP